MPRLRPARRSAAAMRVLVSLAACPGVGAMASTARAWGLASGRLYVSDYWSGTVTVASM